jgi:hypothetical protein
MDWLSVCISMGALAVWILGIRGTYAALSDLLDDDVVAFFFSIVWPFTWPIVGGLSFIWRDG